MRLTESISVAFSSPVRRIQVNRVLLDGGGDASHHCGRTRRNCSCRGAALPAAESTQPAAHGATRRARQRKNPSSDWTPPRTDSVRSRRAGERSGQAKTAPHPVRERPHGSRGQAAPPRAPSSERHRSHRSRHRGSRLHQRRTPGPGRRLAATAPEPRSTTSHHVARTQRHTKRLTGTHPDRFHECAVTVSQGPLRRIGHR